MDSSHDLAPLLLEVLIDLVHEGLSNEVVGTFGNLVAALDKDGEILGHGALLNSLDDGFFESLAQKSEFLVTIKLSSVAKTTGPSEDGSDGVGGG